jgi:multidrug resistance efflux pump
VKINKFFFFILFLFAIAAGYYFYSTDRTSDTVLIGIVDANQVIVSSKIAGRIEKLYVDEGSKVKAGDLIAEIDSAELEAEKNAASATINAYNSQVSSMRATEAQTLGETNSGVVNAQARVAAAKATLAQANADLVRIQSDSQRMIELAKAGVESEQDRVRAEAQLDAQKAVVDSAQKNVLAAQADLDTANAKLHQQRAAASNVAMNEAQVANARAQWAQADTRLGYTKIYAPVTGTVSVRATRQGEVVNPGEAIVTIIDFNDTWVRAEAPETEARFVADGDKLKVRLPAGQPIAGTVIFKAVESDYATQRDVSRRKRDIKTIGLKLKVDNPDGALVPGMTAEVLLPKDLATKNLAEGAR